MLCLYDSGIGGLSVAIKLIQKRPNLAFTYLADTEFLPLGSKSKIEIKNRLEQVSTKVLTTHNLLIQVCNTGSVNTARYLQLDFLPKVFASPKKQILGISRPILELLESRVKPQSKVGILATPATLKSNFYQQELINLKFTAVELSADNLALAIEKKDYLACKNILQKLFVPDLDYVLLACTHYSWIQDLVQKVFPNSIVIDPADFISNQILLYIDQHVEYKSNLVGPIDFLATGSEVDFESKIRQLGFEQKVKHFII
jgi:glutamate racemase